MKTIILSFMLILLVSFVFGFEDYTSNGENNYYNEDSVGIFNGFYETELYETYQGWLLEGGKPIWADIDNNGLTEIYLLENTFLNVYDSNSLEILATFELNSSEHSNIELFDIDNDNKTEIIFTDGENENSFFFEYNGSLILDYYNDISSIMNPINDDISIKCDIDGCVQITARGTTGLISSFNYNDVSTLAYSHTVGGGSVFRLPSSNACDSNDIDNDGVIEYVCVVGRFGSLSTGIIYITYIDGSGDLNIQLKNENLAVSPTGLSATTYKYGITNPTLKNMDSTPNKEIIVGGKWNENEFRMYVYDTSLNLIETVPEDLTLFIEGDGEANGKYLSNTFIMDTEGDNTENVCILGFYNNDTSELSCIDRVKYNAGDEYNFINELSLDLDVTGITNVYGVEAYLDSGDEILTSLGILNIISTNLEIIQSPIISNLHQLPITDDKNGYFDILGIGDSILVNFDDGKINSNCIDDNCFREIEFCPNIVDDYALVNTTFRTRFTLEDVESDNINYTLTIYEDTDNEQSKSGIMSSGDRVTVGTLKLNKSVDVAKASLRYYDVSNPLKTNILELFFGVSDDGTEYNTNNCYTEIEEEITETSSLAGSIYTSCLDNSYCSSDYCEKGICMYKPNNHVCTEDSQCLSNSCFNDRCTKASLIEQTKASIGSMFGFDSASSSLFSILLIVFITLAIIFGTGGHIAGIIAGIFVFISMVIVFVVIGLLHPLALFGLAIVLLLVIALALLFGR